MLALVGVAVLVVSGASWPRRNVGAFGLLLGSMLMGMAASRATVRLRWGAVALVVGSLAFFLFDTEAARAWFALPYGGACVVAGYLLWTNGGGAAQRPTREVNFGEGTYQAVFSSESEHPRQQGE